MIALYSFIKLDRYYKPINNDFIRLAKLSVKSVSRFYKTKIYCDAESLEFFTRNQIHFDEVVVIDEFIDKYKNHSSIGKIYAMMVETEPYISFDFDIVLFEKISTTHTIAYSHPEVTINETTRVSELNWVSKQYHTPFNLHLKDFYTDTSHFNWTTYPCFCILYVNNPLLISSIYKDIFNRLPIETIERIPPVLLEQFLCHQYVLKYKTDFGFLSDNISINNDFTLLDLVSKKYLHININNLNSKNIIKQLETVFFNELIDVNQKVLI
jgi:hypothetical protein